MRSLCVAAGAAVMAFGATPAMAGGCCWEGPTVVYAPPPVAVVVPPTGYVLDPSDARRPVYWVNQGGAYTGADFDCAVPTYSEGGYAFPFADWGVRAYPHVRRYPYVRSYDGGAWFTAPRRFGRDDRPFYRHRPYGHRPYGYRPGGDRQDGGRDVARPRVVRAGVGYGHFAPPYDAYAYRPAPGARVIHVPSDVMERDNPQDR